MSSFAALPTELHLQIGSHCSRPSLRALCRTSKALNQLYTVKLYEEVDLSRKPSRKTMQTATLIYSGKRYIRKQNKFFRTIKARPEYAQYVRSLRWTPVDPSNSRSRTSLLGIQEISTMLVNVSHVEISRTSLHLRQHRYLRDLSLFPIVTSISLVRRVHDILVETVLASNKASQLQTLKLRHVSIGETRHHRKEGPESPTIRFVNSLTGECTKLRSLTIVHDWSSLVDQDDWLKTTLLTSYLALLRSVSGTLETLHFELSYRPDPWFFEAVQAVLQDGTWPRLRKVIVLPPEGDDEPTDSDADSEA
ncbi:hypothetical protein G7Y79_00013g033970 [Physcia stellaris]|nr:hypothetical protein G7Y79_00013g033970 [Physcia stellaris]